MRAGRAFTSAQAAAAAVVLARFARGRRRRRAARGRSRRAARRTRGLASSSPRATRRRGSGRASRGCAATPTWPSCSSSTTARPTRRPRWRRRAAPGCCPARRCRRAGPARPGRCTRAPGPRRGTWILFLDADTRPRPGLARALVALARRRGRGPGVGRPALPLPWRRRAPPAPGDGGDDRLPAGPSDVPGRQPSPARAIVNGQCLLVRRRAFAAWGGWERVRGHLTEDVALARALRGDGRRVAFADAADLLDVRMYEGARATWSGWGRSLMGPDVNGPLRQAEDLAVLWLALALPLPRVLLRRGTPLDAAPARGAARDHGRARTLLPPARRAVLALPARRRARDGPPDVVGAAPRPHLARTDVLTYGAGMGHSRATSRGRRSSGGSSAATCRPRDAWTSSAWPATWGWTGPRSARPSRASSATAWPAPTATASSSRRSTAGGCARPTRSPCCSRASPSAPRRRCPTGRSTACARSTTSSASSGPPTPAWPPSATSTSTTSSWRRAATSTCSRPSDR